MKNILIICDSHGTRWGAIGYAWQIKNKLRNINIEILEYGGVGLNKIYEDIKKDIFKLEFYDMIIIGIGNPDIHPRMPKKIINLLKRFGLTFIRDSYFSVPPIINLSYLIRFPFFLLRLILIRFINETYLSNVMVVEYIDKIVNQLQYKTKKIIILPLFEVNELVYTNTHNQNAIEINTILKKKYVNDLFQSKLLDNNEYKKYYNYDGFHFKTIFHEKLSIELVKIIKEF
jgi:hypothetical protein